MAHKTLDTPAPCGYKRRIRRHKQASTSILCPRGTSIDTLKLLTPAEAAQYLRLNPRTVVRLAREGRIAAIKVGNRWRFKREALAGWSGHKPAGDVSKHTVPRHIDYLSVASLVEPALVILDLEPSDRRGALSKMVAAIADAGRLSDPRRFHELLLEREELMSTGILEGVAVPHPRRAEPGMFEQSFVAVGISRKGIDFGAAGGVPVRLLIVICARDDRSHLQILARISHLLKDTRLVQRLLHATCAREVIDVVAREEEVLRAGTDLVAG